MLTREKIDALVADSLARLTITLDAKPVIYGGLAMEYYGLREHGSDIDLLISEQDLALMWARFPDHRKDIWGDWGLLVDGVEMFRSVYRLDARFYGEGAEELANCRVISIERLLFMKWLAQGSIEKNDRDLALIRQHFMRAQHGDWEAYMNARVPRYLAAPGGVLRGSEIDAQ
jgi:hypothetical protein